MTQLADQPSAMPTRKVTASTAASALVMSIVTAILGVLPEGAGEDVRDAVTILIDWAIGFFVGGGAAGIAGYFVKDKRPERL